MGDLEQELVWSLLAKPPQPPPEAKSHQAPDSGLFESSGTRGYTAGQCHLSLHYLAIHMLIAMVVS